ncbi:putative MFS family arabinose efflux permease [Saccharothrix saharensis]|uniref:Putative MFS family arabinose efflux permease n=1 Tax=Saccharothrix saharensis TaxID=571190 RepID=A0A543JMA8_9PSEU|nr:MFS transporter [Saccharothrix saharensis]TQM83987.1 putative MFS family arabinose efflux permease [Saccharothrix saharensis]
MSRGWVRLQAVAVSGSVAEGLMLAVLPWIAATITSDPRQLSLVNVVGQSPWLLFSLFAGVLVDRVRRSAVLASAYLVQGCAALALAVAGVADAVSLPLLVVLAFVVTSAQVLGDGATGALVPEVVEPGRLATANARLIVIDRGVVQFVVPPAAGFLVAFGLGTPAWVAVGAAVVALALVKGLRSAPATPSTTNPLRDIAEGVRFLVGTRLLLSITVAVALGSFAAAATMAMFVLYVKELLGLGSVGYGVMLAVMAAGWVVSSFVVARVVDRLGYAWSMRLAQVGMVTTILLLAVLPGRAWMIAVVVFVQSAIVMVWNVCSQSSRQRFTPPVLLGRVLTSHRALAWGLTPLGALAGGFVAAGFGLRAVWVVATVIQVGALVTTWRGLSPEGFREAELVAAAR